MLRIKKVKKYTVAQYPQGIYRVKPDSPAQALWKGSVSSAVMLAILESCDGVGTTGPPPVLPEMVTENEARNVIERVFDNNDIDLQEDVDYLFRYGINDSTQLDLDGYNDSLNVGYEYIAGADSGTFTPEVINALDSAQSDSGPYVKTVDEFERSPDFETYLENLIQEFIDTLKVQGII